MIHRSVPLDFLTSVVDTAEKFLAGVIWVFAGVSDSDEEFLNGVNNISEASPCWNQWHQQGIPSSCEAMALAGNSLMMSVTSANNIKN